jgi:hypothetical protein
MYSVQDTLAGGFPHSEIFGSKLVRSSPKHIAAYHVLHRLSAPRHPPNALKTLDHSHFRCPSRALAQNGIDRKDQLLRDLPDRSGLSLRVRATDPLPGLGQTFSSRCQKSRNRPEPMRIVLCVRTLRSAGCRHERIAIKGSNWSLPSEVWWSQPVRPQGRRPEDEQRDKSAGFTTSEAKWWSQTGSNRRPPACKAGALPTELWPRQDRQEGPAMSTWIMVGPGRLELPTSRLSGVRSNHLSYGPPTRRCGVARAEGAKARSHKRVREERETKTAVSRHSWS